ncbi:MAG: minor capsid protein, partial [Spirochaetaceae bacterium]|nr:minor capsid protein [Spirochaetaceae bacterium]
WENVYRTNIQTNYNAGRAMRFEKNRPEYLEFIGIEDSRQTGICEARSGVVRPYDDPWWKENWPPLHFQCRSTVRGIYPEEATARGLTATDIPEGLDPSQKGFGANPLDEESYWKPTGRMRERVAEQLVYGEVKEVEDRLIGGKEEVPVFKSVKEAEQWALSHNVADQVGFKGAKPEVAREFIKAVYDTVWERPKLRANFKFIGTIQERNRRLKAYHRGLVKEELIKKGYPAEKAEEHAKLWVKRYVKIPPVPSRAYAQSAPARGGYGAVQGISINEKFAKNPAELARSLKRDVDQGFHPPGTDSVKALTDHEIGHQLDDMLAVGKNSDIIDLYKGMSADVRASKLSVYGSTSKSEFIAEAWSEYQNNPQPREVARRVGEHITKELDT